MFDGQTIEEMLQWVSAHPTQVDGVVERYRMIKEMRENPYDHYYGYNRPID
jgi:hypothetical protein